MDLTRKLTYGSFLNTEKTWQHNNCFTMNSINKKSNPILSALLMSFVLMGHSQGSDNVKHYKESIYLDVQTTEAWRLITDVSIWKIWDERIIDVDLEGSFKRRARGKLITSNSRLVDFAITDFIEGETYTLKHKLSSGMFYMKRSIQASDSGSTITEEVWVKGLSPKTTKKYLGEEHGLVIRSNLENLRRYIDNKN